MALVKIVALFVVTVLAGQPENTPLHARLLAECGDDKSEEGCKCLMGCEVMGGDSSSCGSDKVKNDAAFAEKYIAAASDNKKLCDIVKCFVYCTKSLGCGQEGSKVMCEAQKTADKDCDAVCDGVGPAAALSLTAILLAMLQI